MPGWAGAVALSTSLGAGPGSGLTAEGCTDGADGATGPLAAVPNGPAGLTGTAETSGTGATTPEGETDRVCAVMTSTTTAAPVRARHPPAATNRPHLRRSLVWRRKSSHESSLAARLAVSRSGGWIGAALVAAAGAAGSVPIRSRRARNSSIARIWSASDSSTTTPNGAPGPLDAEVYANGLTR